MALSPMMQQYTDIKKQYEDCILFFRLGDFYEMFFDDAKTVSRELELTLTGKNCGLEERAPMCGVPFHSAEGYIAKLIDRGYKVAICEQTEDPAAAKGIVKREIVQIVTPGTLTSQYMLKENENNYLASVYNCESGIGFAYCDISTGETYCSEFKEKNAIETLINEIVKIGAKEIIINDRSSELIDIDRIQHFTEGFFEPLEDTYYNKRACIDVILRQFNVQGLFGLGIEDESSIVYALGALMQYMIDTQKHSLDHITEIYVYDIGMHMVLDKATIRNLELTETLYDKKLRGSLLAILDKTKTAMGSRKIKQWIKEPLNNSDQINKRLDAVEYILNERLIRNDLRESLKHIYDFERLAGRIACGRANGKDLAALKNSCLVLPEIKHDLENTKCALLDEIKDGIDTLEDLHRMIDAAIVDDPPFTIKEGGVIKEGYSSELDDLKASVKDAVEWIARLEHEERERTGINNLKVGFNKVFGYYLEITKSNYDRIPDDYIRKQSLKNAERFITPELKQQEGLVLNAEVKINDLEYRLFDELRKELQGYTVKIQKTSKNLAVLDVLVSFAYVSDISDYVKPEVNDDMKIIIEKGRHPVIEESISDGIFVSNDTYMDRDDMSMLLVTGPNMSGKSTYMRQTALIVLMAQMGCFVPCEKAKIGTVDRIFTRIGASDNLTQGQSTFFVEMSELAYILNSATAKSLVILDEIGRGTSTYDGLSIAWAVVEYLCRDMEQVRTMFATHYHELTMLEGHVKGLKNLNITVARENGEVIFLHKIAEGSASQSYGIEVAKLAGVPDQLLDKAAEKLRELEQEHAADIIINDKVITSTKGSKERGSDPDCSQLSFFDLASDPVAERLRSLDLMRLTPSEAFKILEELKKEADK